MIREARPDDRAPIAALLASIAEFNADEIAVAKELVDAAVDRTDDYRVLVDVEGSTARGYVCFGPTPMTSGTWDLYWIATAPDARRSGVGRALVDALFARLREERARLVRVETSSRADYDATRAFYDRTGFVVAARIRDFYDLADDLVIYARYL